MTDTESEAEFILEDDEDDVGDDGDDFVDDDVDEDFDEEQQSGTKKRKSSSTKRTGRLKLTKKNGDDLANDLRQSSLDDVEPINVADEQNTENQPQLAQIAEILDDAKATPPAKPSPTKADSPPSASPSSGNIKPKDTATIHSPPTTSHNSQPSPPSIKYPSGVAGTLARYLISQNRPFGPTDMARKFNGQMSRGQINKALEQLVESGMICASNDRKIFWAEQSQLGEVTDKGIQSLMQTLEQLKQQHNTINGDVEAAKHNVREVLKTPPNSELDAKSSQVASEIETMNATVAGQKEANAQTVKNVNASLSTDPDALTLQFKFFKGMWRERKRVVTDLCCGIVDNSSKKIKLAKFMDEIGVETDEEHKVSLKEVTLKG